MGIKDDKYLNPDAGVEYTLSPEYARPMAGKIDGYGNERFSWGVTVLEETRQQGGKAVVTPINKKVYWGMKQKAYDMVCEADLRGGCKCYLSVMPETMQVKDDKTGKDKTIKFNKYCLVYNDKPFYSHPTSPEANSDPNGAHVKQQYEQEAEGQPCEGEGPPPPDEQYPEEVKPEETPDQPENEYTILNARAELLEACVGKAVKIVEPYNKAISEDGTETLFTSEDVRTMANTLFMQVCKETWKTKGYER